MRKIIEKLKKFLLTQLSPKPPTLIPPSNIEEQTELVAMTPKEVIQHENFYSIFIGIDIQGEGKETIFTVYGVHDDLVSLSIMDQLSIRAKKINDVLETAQKLREIWSADQIIYNSYTVENSNVVKYLERFFKEDMLSAVRIPYGLDRHFEYNLSLFINGEVRLGIGPWDEKFGNHLSNFMMKEGPSTYCTTTAIGVEHWHNLKTQTENQPITFEDTAE